jgi:hypothetical protein
MTRIGSEKAMIQIVLPDGTLVERHTDVFTAFKVLDLLTRSPTISSEPCDTGASPADATESAIHIKSDASHAPVRNLQIPSSGQLLKFIRSKDDYAHSVDEIAREFIGQDVSGGQIIEVERFKNAIRRKLNRVRDEIERQEAGRWEEDRVGQYKTFRFIKSGDLSKYQEHESRD